MLSFIYDISMFVFILAALAHLILMLLLSDQIRKESGSHFQIVFRIGKRGGFLGWGLVGSFLLTLSCFALWVFNSIFT